MQKLIPQVYLGDVANTQKDGEIIIRTKNLTVREIWAGYGGETDQNA